MMKAPELLCPAGDLTRLKCAVDFGADAVYLAGREFGMRAGSANFSAQEMRDGIKYAHKNGVSVHVTCNITPHNGEVDRIAEFAKSAAEAGADAFIVGDLGAIDAVREGAPNAVIHASVQAGVTNYRTARALYNMGVKRVVLARELSIDEIAEIRAKTPSDLEIETFVHGAMCVSYSGRCLLSRYMTGRDANHGDCAQSCRWSYSLVESNRPGQYYDITETDKGTYILNADDLCMAEHIADLARAGVCSLKIEGRAKSHYYVAVTTNAYRGALDAFAADNGAPCPEWVMSELNKISHRNYSTGFFYGRPDDAVTYKSAGYIRDYSVAAVVEDYRDGCIVASLKNKFFSGTVLDCLEPHSAPFDVPTDVLLDENKQPIDMANKPTMTIMIPFERSVTPGSLLRMAGGQN